MEHAWQRILAILEKSLNPGHFQIWIKPLQATLTQNRLELIAPNEFVAAWVRDKLYRPLMEAAAEVLGVTPVISIEAGVVAKTPSRDAAPAVGQGRRSSASQSAQPVPSDDAKRARAPRAPSRERASELYLPMASGPRFLTAGADAWRFRFDDFVVGPSNELAFAASRSLCRDAMAADQLFLCSGPGLGKTHLLQAIGHSMADDARRQPRIAYLTAEEFATKMIMAIKAKEVPAFKASIREGVDVLLLEDVHFLQGKEKIQDEFLSTLKALSSRGCRVVLTSSFLPKELSGLDSQLVSRFCAGFMAVIERPDFETRLRIIENKATRKFGVAMPDGVAELLAERIHADVRQLESCLHNLILKARLLGQSITMDLAWDTLRHFDLAEARRVNIDSIVKAVCECYQISYDQLSSKSRKKELVLARNTAFFLARKHTPLSLKDIGERFNRKHSTVLKGITNLEIEMSKQTPLGRQITSVIERLQL